MLVMSTYLQLQHASTNILNSYTDNICLGLENKWYRKLTESEQLSRTKARKLHNVKQSLASQFVAN